MYLKLIRNKPSGKAIFGRLLVDCENVSGFQSFKLQMDTLEHTDYAAMLRDFFDGQSKSLAMLLHLFLYKNISVPLQRIKTNNK